MPDSAQSERERCAECQAVTDAGKSTTCPACPCRREEDEVAHLLHTMHDASKFADGAAKAILEGVLHAKGYGRREGPHRGNRCECPHCTEDRLPVGQSENLNILPGGYFARLLRKGR